MPTSTAGNRQPKKPQRGFTLFELLVVLAIIAVAMTLTSPALGRFFKPRLEAPPAERLIAAIAQARDDAMRRGQVFRGFLNLLERRFESAGGKILLLLPEGFYLEATHDRNVLLLPCRFALDGSGCGMSVRLLDNINPPLILTVDPLTGRVRLKPEPPESQVPGTS